MWPQIISSLSAAVMLAAAAIMLNSPLALLGIAFACMLAWLSHMPNASRATHLFTTLIGLLIGAVVWVYLLSLIIART